MLEPFKSGGVVMTIVGLVMELEKYKKAYKKLKDENEFLRGLLQTKQPFEARV